MSDTTNAAAALIRRYAAAQYEVAGSYFDLGETEAGNRATQIADEMEVAAHLLRGYADPPYDAKAAAASVLAGAAWRVVEFPGPGTLDALKDAIAAYDAISEED